MGIFSYTVQDTNGETKTGLVEAADEDAAIESLQARALFVLAIQPVQGKGGLGKAARRAPKIKGGISGREMIFLGEQLSTLIGGGIPLVRALSLLSAHTRNRNLGSVLAAVTRDVSAGTAMHKALGKHPKVFNEIWVSLIMAGELSGQLPAVLRQITSYIESQENVKSKIITAVSYPAVLMVMSVGVLIYFITYIVPVFSTVFKDYNIQLPPLTLALVTFSDLARRFALVGLLAITGFIFAMRAYIATPLGRLMWNRVLFRTPVFGGLLYDIQTERLVTTMGTLLRSGVSIVNALSVLEEVFKKNLIFQNCVKDAKNRIVGGGSISESFRKTGVLPDMATEMMWMGEESGKLPDVVGVLSKFYQEQIDQFLRRFSAVIDPILIIGVGGIIAVVIMGIFLPIFQLSKVGAS